MDWTIFDIETGPLSDRELRDICPPFDESSIKFGRTTDPVKRKAKVDAARASHFDDFKSRAALCPATGRVIVIATCTARNGEIRFLESEKESDMLADWWQFVSWSKRAANHRLAGVNILDFDLPFLVRRSWILDVAVPSFVIELSTKWQNWDGMFCDIRLAWQCGNRMATSSFDYIGRAFGTGGKSVGDIGKSFSEVYTKDRKLALEYAANDVRQPAIWLYRMGLISGQEIPETLFPAIDAEFSITNDTNDDKEPIYDNENEPAFDAI